MPHTNSCAECAPRSCTCGPRMPVAASHGRCALRMLRPPIAYAGDLSPTRARAGRTHGVHAHAPGFALACPHR